MKIQRIYENDDFWLEESKERRIAYKYRDYLMNKYEVSNVMLSINLDKLEFNFSTRKYQNPLCRDRLMKLIEDFKNYNWYIDSPDFCVPMSKDEMRSYFEKIEEEVKIKENSDKYNL